MCTHYARRYPPEGCFVAWRRRVGRPSLCRREPGHRLERARRYGVTTAPADRRLLVLLILLAFCRPFALPSVLPAQTEPPELETTQMSAEQIRAELQSAENDPDLDETLQTQIAELYRQAMAELDAMEGLLAPIEKRQNDISQIEDRRQEVERLRAELPSEVNVIDSTNLSMEQLEEKTKEAQQELEQAQNQLAEFQDEIARRQTRRVEIPAAISELKKEAGEIGNQLTETPATQVPQKLAKADRVRHSARRKRIQREIESLSLELEYYNKAEELLRQQAEVAQQTKDLAEKKLSLWNEAAAARRQAIVKSQVEQAQSRAAAVAPELKTLAEKNLQNVQKQQKLADDIEVAANRLAEVQKLFNEWDNNYDQMFAQIAPQSAISESVGLDLRNQRTKLPDVAALRRESKTTRGKIFDTRFEQLANNAELLRLSTLDTYVPSELDRLSIALPDSRLAELEPELRSLLEDQREHTDAVKS